jgi:hypothetical protein
MQIISNNILYPLLLTQQITLQIKHNTYKQFPLYIQINPINFQTYNHLENRS